MASMCGISTGSKTPICFVLSQVWSSPCVFHLTGLPGAGGLCGSYVSQPVVLLVHVLSAGDVSGDGVPQQLRAR